MKISLELVPREANLIEEEVRLVLEKYPMISMINFPDLLKVKIRSWQACGLIKPFGIDAMPHLRAKDFDLEDMNRVFEMLDGYGISQVLVLGGDMPQDVRKIYPTSTIDLIQAIKRNRPKISVYGTLDPYRSSLRNELEGIFRKKDAGVDGFFTQPFFDIRFMSIFRERLEETDVFWGVSPVLADSTRSYWETKNQVILPKGFQCSMDWNVTFAKEALNFARDTQTNIYFMPISIPIDTYLNKVFDGYILLD
jgi:methylenetetrahydrofolate reductase (NADPH)